MTKEKALHIVKVLDAAKNHISEASDDVYDDVNIIKFYYRANKMEGMDYETAANQARAKWLEEFLLK